MEKLNQIRNLIIEHKISEACNRLSPVDLDFRDQIDLLHAQFNNWDQSYNLGKHPPKEDLNRIIFSILCIISQIEQKHKKNKINQPVDTLLLIEKDLVEDYEAYAKMKAKKQGLIDLFMNWMRTENRMVYRRLLQQEKILGKVINLEEELSGLDFSNFMEKYNFKASQAEIIQYYLGENNRISSFFNGWKAYNEQQVQTKSLLENRIRENEFKHWQLFGTSFLGGLFGATSIYLFNPLDFDDDDDDDDDDDFGNEDFDDD